MDQLFDDFWLDEHRKPLKRRRSAPETADGEPASAQEAAGSALKIRPIDTKVRSEIQRTPAASPHVVDDASALPTMIRVKTLDPVQPADMTPTEAMYVAPNLRSHVLAGPACLLPTVLEVTFDAAAVPLKCRRLTRERHQDILRQLAELETGGWPTPTPPGPPLRDGFTGELLPEVPVARMPAADVQVILERWAAIDEWWHEHGHGAV